MASVRSRVCVTVPTGTSAHMNDTIDLREERRYVGPAPLARPSARRGVRRRDGGAFRRCCPAAIGAALVLDVSNSDVPGASDLGLGV